MLLCHRIYHFCLLPSVVQKYCIINRIVAASLNIISNSSSRNKSAPATPLNRSVTNVSTAMRMSRSPSKEGYLMVPTGE